MTHTKDIYQERAENLISDAINYIYKEVDESSRALIIQSTKADCRDKIAYIAEIFRRGGSEYEMRRDFIAALWMFDCGKDHASDRG